MMWLGREVLSLLGGHNSLYGEVSNAMGMIVNVRQYPQQTIVWNAAHGLQQQHTAGREIQWSLKIRGVADSGPYWGKELDFQILWVDEFAVRGSRLGGGKVQEALALTSSEIWSSSAILVQGTQTCQFSIHCVHPVHHRGFLF
jgi:hypothetical protein